MDFSECCYLTFLVQATNLDNLFPLTTICDNILLQDMKEMQLHVIPYRFIEKIKKSTGLVTENMLCLIAAHTWLNVSSKHG
jgi:hypothetical protein